MIWGNYFLQVNFLGTIGGENVKDCVRRTMKSLITTDMAVKFNWKGKGEKNALFVLAIEWSCKK